MKQPIENSHKEGHPARLEISEDELPSQVRDRLEAMLRSRGEGAGSTLLAMRREIHSGPFPHPELLRAYEEVCPGFAQHLIDEHKKSSAHIRFMGKFHLIGSFVEIYIGQAFAFCIALAFLYFGYQMVEGGKTISGSLMMAVGTALVGIVTAIMRKKSGSASKTEGGREESGRQASPKQKKSGKK